MNTIEVTNEPKARSSTQKRIQYEPPPIASERKGSRDRYETVEIATELRQSAKIRTIYCSGDLLLSVNDRWRRKMTAGISNPRGGSRKRGTRNLGGQTNRGES